MPNRYTLALGNNIVGLNPDGTLVLTENPTEIAIYTEEFLDKKGYIGLYGLEALLAEEIKSIPVGDIAFMLAFWLCKHFEVRLKGHPAITGEPK